MSPDILFCLFFTLSYIQISRGERRITDGQKVEGKKRYMVYLLKSPSSKTKYDAWLCGGVLVSPLYVVTSAACVEDVKYSYVIAGYNKYIQHDKIDDDPCTKEKKKKVVYICIPKAYNFDYEKIELWSNIDIAVARVESPYDFNDNSYESICSYTPNAITINYEPKYQQPGIEAFVLGWGHLSKWRSSDDTHNYNQEELHYAPSLIHDKEDCKKQYDHYPQLHKLIDKYMICTLGSGNLNYDGNIIVKSKPDAEGCDVADNTQPKQNSDQNNETNKEANNNTSKKHQNVNKILKNRSFDLYPDYFENYHELGIQRRSFSYPNTTLFNVTRRQGICQNDHGGPLVTWVGGKEVLIGVASVFLLNQNSECTGPYLFTSTQCNSAFLNCILGTGDEETRRRCNQPAAIKGFDMSERNISWVSHPDGPAENELVKTRPQIPMNYYARTQK